MCRRYYAARLSDVSFISQGLANADFQFTPSEALTVLGAAHRNLCSRAALAHGQNANTKQNRVAVKLRGSFISQGFTPSEALTFFTGEGLPESWEMESRTEERLPKSWEMQSRTEEAFPESWEIKSRTEEALPKSWEIKSRAEERLPKSWEMESRTEEAFPESWEIKSRTGNRRAVAWSVSVVELRRGSTRVPHSNTGIPNAAPSVY